MGILFRKPRLVHILQVKPGLIVKSLCKSDPRRTVYGYIAGKFGKSPYTGERATDTVFCPDETPRFKENVTAHLPSVYVDSGNNYLAIGKISLPDDNITHDAYPYGLMNGDRVLKREYRKELMAELADYHLKHQGLPVFKIPKAGTYTLGQLNRFLRMER